MTQMQTGSKKHKLLVLVSKEPHLSKLEMAHRIGSTERSVMTMLAELAREGHIERRKVAANG